MERPNKSRRILLLAALISMGSHWLVLRGVDLDFLAEESGSATTVMLTTIAVAQAPTLRQNTAQAGTQTPPQKSATVTSSPAETMPTQPAPAPEAETPSAQGDEQASAAQQSHTQKALAPQSGQVQFQVFLGDGEGDALAAMTHTFQFSEGRYELGSRGEALGFMALLYSGLLTQHSSGMWDESGFSTRAYSEQRGKKPEARVQIDDDKKEAVFSNGNHVALASLHVNDRLSVMYQLGLQLMAHGNAYDPPPMEVLSSSALEKWQFVRIGVEKVRLGEMSVDAIHFQRRHAEGQEKTGIDIWYDTGSDPWPLQIRLTDKKGMVITQKRALAGPSLKKPGSALP